MNWRIVLRNLHLVAGLLAGAIALAVGLSGSILTFRAAIEHALYEPKVVPQGTRAPMQSIYAQVKAIEPEQRRVTVVVLPEEVDAPLEFVLGRRGARTLKESDQLSVYADPYSATLLGQRHRNDSFIAWLRDLHFALLAGTTGYKLNGWMALTLVFIALTGFVLWLQMYVPGKAFTVNWAASWKRVTWDLHRVAGLLAMVFLMLVALTGAYYPFRETVTKWMAGASLPVPPRGAPAVIATPGALPLEIDAIIAKARPVLADAHLAVLRPPATPVQAWTATFHRPGDEGESVDSGPTAYLDPFTGAVLRVDDPRALGWTGKVLKAIEPLHYGKFFGWPHKVLWLLLGIMPGFLFVSGVVMWWNRTRGARRIKAPAPAMAQAD